MAKSDMFNREMGDYLHRRLEKKNRLFSGFKIKVSPQFEEEDNRSVPDLASNKVHVVYGKQGFLERLFAPRRDYREVKEEEEGLEEMREEIEATDRQIEDVEEVEHELEEKREGLTKRFFRALFGQRQPDDVDVDMPLEKEPEPEPIDPELKEVLRISGKWLNRLDKKTKAQFRESQDFEKYKFYLDTRGLTKRK